VRKQIDPAHVTPRNDGLCRYAKFLGLRPAIKQSMCMLLQQRVHVVAALEFHPNSRSRLSEFGTSEMLTILDR
jgi:hypothetical protein